MHISLTDPVFVGQVWGTLLGPFINYGMMRFIIDNIGVDVLTGVKHSLSWSALQTKNFYSLSVLWGVIGPKNFFGPGSEYSWLYWGFLVGPLAVMVMYGIQRWKPQCELSGHLRAIDHLK